MSISADIPVFLPSTQQAFRFLHFGNCTGDDQTIENVELANSAGNCYLKEPKLYIESAVEFTFGSSVFLVAIAVFMLHRFIQEYAYSLVDRKNHVRNLSKINADLKEQMKA